VRADPRPCACCYSASAKKRQSRAPRGLLRRRGAARRGSAQGRARPTAPQVDHRRRAARGNPMGSARMTKCTESTLARLREAPARARPGLSAAPHTPRPDHPAGHARRRAASGRGRTFSAAAAAFCAFHSSSFRALSSAAASSVATPGCGAMFAAGSGRSAFEFKMSRPSISFPSLKRI
jgi:hypothetical protein